MCIYFFLYCGKICPFIFSLVSKESSAQRKLFEGCKGRSHAGVIKQFPSITPKSRERGQPEPKRRGTNTHKQKGNYAGRRTNKQGSNDKTLFRTDTDTDSRVIETLV